MHRFLLIVVVFVCAGALRQGGGVQGGTFLREACLPVTASVVGWPSRRHAPPQHLPEGQLRRPGHAANGKDSVCVGRGVCPIAHVLASLVYPSDGVGEVLPSILAGYSCPSAVDVGAAETCPHALAGYVSHHPPPHVVFVPLNGSGSGYEARGGHRRSHYLHIRRCLEGIGHPLGQPLGYLPDHEPRRQEQGAFRMLIFLFPVTGCVKDAATETHRPLLSMSLHHVMPCL